LFRTSIYSSVPVGETVVITRLPRVTVAVGVGGGAGVGVAATGTKDVVAVYWLPW